MFILIISLFILINSSDPLWHSYSLVPIYETCDIIKASKKVFAGTQDAWATFEDDFAVRFNFKSGTPEMNATCHNGMVHASRNGDTYAAIAYDKHTFVTTLFVWKGTDTKPQYSLVLDQIQVPADKPALKVSDDGNYIVALGVNGDEKEAVLYIFSPSSPKPLQLWKSESGSTNDVRHLAISKNGKIIAFHLDQITSEGSDGTPNIAVYDFDQEGIRWKYPTVYTNNGLGLSENGDYISFGLFSHYLFKWNEDKSTYEKVFQNSISEGNHVEQCILDDVGNSILGLSDIYVRKPSLEYYNVKGELVWSYEYGFDEGKLQDVIWDLSLTSNGKYLAIATWGNLTTVNKEIRVFDTQSKNSVNKPIYQYHLQGSAFCVDIVQINDDLYIVGGGKHGHANVMGHGGDLYLWKETP